MGKDEYLVSKLVFCCEFLTARTVVLDEDGFIEQDANENLVFCHRRENNIVLASSSEPLSTALLEPDPLLYNLESAKQPLQIVSTLFEEKTLSDALCVRLQREDSLNRTRVQLYWRCWTNCNTLTAEFAFWFIESTRKQLSVFELLRNSLRACGNANKNEQISIAAQRFCSTLPEESDFSQNTCVEDFVTCSLFVDELLQGDSGKNNTADQKSTLPAKEYYFFNFNAIDFIEKVNSSKFDVLQENSKTRISLNDAPLTTLCSATISQKGAKLLYRLGSRSWRNAFVQSKLCLWLSKLAKHIESVVPLDLQYSCHESCIGAAAVAHQLSHQRTSQQFGLNFAGQFANENNQRHLESINIGNCGWWFDVVACKMFFEETRPRSEVCTFPLALESNSIDTDLFYDNSLATRNDWKRIKWSTKPNSIVKVPNRPLSIVNQSTTNNDRVGILKYAVQQSRIGRTNIAQNAFFARHQGEKSSHAYFEDIWGAHSASLQQLFELFGHEANQEQKHAFQSCATLIVCDEVDVWRWLFAFSKILDDSDASVKTGKHSQRQNVIDLVCANQVYARLHSVVNLADYANLSFADVLLCDVLLVTSDLLAQLRKESCNYISDFDVDSFCDARWIDALPHVVNSLSAKSLYSVCKRKRKHVEPNIANCVFTPLSEPCNVVLEAIAWQTLVLDTPWSDYLQPSNENTNNVDTLAKKPEIYCSFEEIAKRNVVECFAKAIWSQAGESTMHTIVTAKVDMPSAYVCKSSRLFQLALAAGHGPALLKYRDFINYCSVHVLPQSLDMQINIVHVSMDKQHKAIVNDALLLMAQLQDLQALECDSGNKNDTLQIGNLPHRQLIVCGASSNNSALDQQHAVSRNDLKPTYRYLLHFLEHNKHFADILRDSIAEQILQRAARFLSQFNHDYQHFHNLRTERERDSERNAKIAGKAFYKMLEFRNQMMNANESNSSCAAEGLVAVDHSAPHTNLPPQSASINDNENSPLQSDVFDDEENLPSNVFSSDSDDIQGFSESNSEDESGVDFAQSFDSEPLQFIESLAARHGSHFAQTVRAQAEEWNMHWSILFGERSIGTSLSTVRARARLFAAFENEEEHLLLREYDPETGIGFCNVGECRVLLQRVEILRKNLQLSYKMCLTSIKDRKLVSLVNFFASVSPCLLDNNSLPLESATGLELWTPPCLEINRYSQYYKLFDARTLRSWDENAERASDILGDCEVPLSADYVQNESQVQQTFQNSADKWQASAAKIRQNQDNLLAHYKSTLASLLQEQSETKTLLCAQIRLLVRLLCDHPAKLLDAAIALEDSDFQKLLCDSTVCERHINDDQKEQIYQFFGNHVYSLLQDWQSLTCLQPPLSVNFSYMTEQVIKFRRNTKWLDRDIAFIESQIERVFANQKNLKQTIDQMILCNQNANSDGENSDDDSNSLTDSNSSCSSKKHCIVCYDKVADRDVCLFACGHWCCWDCFESSGEQRCSVNDDIEDENQWICIARKGIRCFYCRYIEQGNESVQKIQLAKVAQQDVAFQKKRRIAEKPDEQQVAKESDDATTVTKSAPQSTVTVNSTNQKASQTPVFCKSETVLQEILLAIDAARKDRNCARIIVYSQYAAQLQEVYNMLRRNVHSDVLAFMSTSQRWLLDHQNATKEQKVPKKRKAGDDSVICDDQKHMVAFKHIDLTRNLSSAHDSQMKRYAPPLQGVTHAFFLEAFCVRLGDDNAAIDCTKRLKLKLLEETCALSKSVQVVEFCIKDGIDQTIWNQ